MSRFDKISFAVCFILVVVAVCLIVGCNTTYRPPIIDIRDEPYPIDWAPSQPEKFADVILEFQRMRTLP